MKIGALVLGIGIVAVWVLALKLTLEKRGVLLRSRKFIVSNLERTALSLIQLGEKSGDAPTLKVK